MPLIYSPYLLLLHHDRPYVVLSLLFVAWKLLLFSLVLLAPGRGYDTSTTLLPPLDNDLHNYSIASRLERLLASKFVRWDAIYFTQSAKRGYVYEQEWAFGWGHTQSLGLATRLLHGREDIETQHIAVVGVVLAHFFHWAGTLVLYELTKAVFDTVGNPEHNGPGLKARRKNSSLALLASVLHVLSPAGVFLSAPYAEALFSLLNLAGFYAYAKCVRLWKVDSGWRAFVLHLLAGIVFGVAATVRGNGLFSGLLLVYDAVEGLREAFGEGRIFAFKSFQKTLSAGVSGLVMGVIASLPQVLAYQEFCDTSRVIERRPWCQAWPPSIYTWVQKEYWGVGFLRYWTFSNLPLFILAAPMLTIMTFSCVWSWKSSKSKLPPSQGLPAEKIPKRQDRGLETLPGSSILFRLSIPQIALAVLACTTYHVQVITRLSSGYAVWYWWLAILLTGESDDQQQQSVGNIQMGRIIVVWMIMYAIIQGSLYASFLPPA